MFESGGGGEHIIFVIPGGGNENSVLVFLSFENNEMIIFTVYFYIVDPRWGVLKESIFCFQIIIFRFSYFWFVKKTRNMIQRDEDRHSHVPTLSFVVFQREELGAPQACSQFTTKESIECPGDLQILQAPRLPTLLNALKGALEASPMSFGGPECDVVDSRREEF